MTEQDPNLTENPEPLPDRETPLADLVGEEFLGEDDRDGYEEYLGEDEFDDAEDERLADIASRRIPPSAHDDDLREGLDDSATRDQMAEDQPEIIRQRQEGRLTLLPLALGFIGAGGLLLADRIIDDFTFKTGWSLIILIGALMMTYIIRFFGSGRRERGLFFIAMVLLTWGSLVGLNLATDGDFSFNRFWPLFISGVGVAFILTFIFERTHQIGLLFPAILMIYSSGIAVLTTQDVINQQMQDAVLNYGALVVAFIGLTLIPTAIRER